ncbi:MAG: Ig-like domain-containing protein, partial [Butyrivibrio sp.]|nr:Ig-like domain-containing protein [Butyrivibrio sp.]
CVYNGKIRAKGIGEAEITIFSQSGSAKRTVNVKVEAAEAAAPCEKIEIEESYELTAGDYVYLDAKVNADCDAFLTYRSSDEGVATVSSVGKVLAVGEGSAVITVCSSDGYSAEADVKVGAKQSAAEITLALNVYFNDSGHGYFNNEVSSQTVTVDKEGQYTLKFDCAADLSQAAADAGVTSLSNLTAIYIKDYDVTCGNTTVSPLKSCDIMYDSVIVNGEELTVTQKEPKSALKDSGIFDTNDPVNSWDGSSVEEVKCSGNVANFSTIENPTTVEVTFTLSNMEFD